WCRCRSGRIDSCRTIGEPTVIPAGCFRGSVAVGGRRPVEWNVCTTPTSRWALAAYHSCHHRACPRCGGHRTAEWTARQEARLLPVGYFLVTFTVPEELRWAFAARPELLHDLLFTHSAAA